MVVSVWLFKKKKKDFEILKNKKHNLILQNETKF